MHNETDDYLEGPIKNEDIVKTHLRQSSHVTMDENRGTNMSYNHNAAQSSRQVTRNISS